MEETRCIVEILVAFIDDQAIHHKNGSMRFLSSNLGQIGDFLLFTNQSKGQPIEEQTWQHQEKWFCEWILVGDQEHNWCTHLYWCINYRFWSCWSNSEQIIWRVWSIHHNYDVLSWSNLCWCNTLTNPYYA